MSKNKIIYSLEGLRGFAVILVFLAHIPGDSKIDLGQAGVLIFFVLSAFLMFLPFFAKKTTKITLRTYTSYLMRRFFRIFPVYLVVLLFTLIWYYLVGNPTGITSTNIVDNIILFINTDLIHIVDSEFLQIPRVAIVNVTWTLVIELQFYLVVPFVAVLINRVKFNKYYVFLFLIILGNIIRYILIIYDRSYFSPLFIRYIDIFAFGALAAYLYSNKIYPKIFKIKNFELNNINISSIVFIVFIVGTLFMNRELFGHFLNIEFFVDKIDPFVLIVVYPLFAFSIFLLIMLMVNNEDNWVAKMFSFPLLQFVGLSGYAFYLIHRQLLHISFPQSLTTLIIVFAIILIISYLLHVCIEKPFIVIGKTIASAIENKQKIIFSKLLKLYFISVSSLVVIGLIICIVIF